LEDNPANVWSNNALTSFSKATVMCCIVQASPEQSLFSYFTDVERYGPELTSFLKGRLVFLVRSLHLHIQRFQTFVLIGNRPGASVVEQIAEQGVRRLS
jgi:hypothetical protein